MVVWWRDPVGKARSPRVHEIGWVDTTGRPHGRLGIPSPHLRLDPGTIEAALADHLVPHPYLERPAIAAAGLTDLRLLSSEARLIVDGHTVSDMELSVVYDLDVVAVVSARLYATGPRAVIAVEEGVSAPVREATMAAARRAVATFAAAPGHELAAHGWSRQGEDAWQLLLHQP